MIFVADSRDMAITQGVMTCFENWPPQNVTVSASCSPVFSNTRTESMLFGMTRRGEVERYTPARASKVSPICRLPQIPRSKTSELESEDEGEAGVVLG